MMMRTAKREKDAMIKQSLKKLLEYAMRLHHFVHVNNSISLEVIHSANWICY